ncbi:hypothetical protein ACSBR2_030629 [Camellia fascicularis]
MEEILAQINIHCKNFSGFSAFHANIKKDEATIVTSVPHIVFGVKGCKKLVYFDVTDCKAFDCSDDEILKLASHIKTFKDEGSHLTT